MKKNAQQKKVVHNKSNGNKKVTQKSKKLKAEAKIAQKLFKKMKNGPVKQKVIAAK